jgi:hypothetical protein
MGFFDPQIELEFDEGEHIIYMTRRHWSLLVRDSILPFIIGISSVSLAAYRAAGGGFFAGGVGEAGRIDIINIILLLLVAIITVFWLRPRPPKTKSRTWPYVIPIAILLLVFYFRYQGGQLFFIDPSNAGNGGDLINILLIVTTIGSILYLLYVAIDWRDNALILTNYRVVYDDEQFLIRHVQQQISIDDVQQVNVRANRYLEYWLGYGTISVSSFSLQKLEVTYITKPQLMQSKIQGELNKLRKQQEPQLLRQLLEDQVYGNKPPPKPTPSIYVVQRSGPVPWLFPANPQIDTEKEMIIWRPSWIYVSLFLLRPFLVLISGTIILILLAQFGILSALWAFAIWIPLLLVCGFWIFWVREEWNNDVYILTRSEVQDVDKRPFGPESRRRATLDRIQDISFDVNIIERFLGYGDVIIKTGGGGGDFTFNHVPDPRGVQATINDYLTDYKRRQKEAAFQQNVALLREYHSVQVAHGEVVDEDKLTERVAARIGGAGRSGDTQIMSQEQIAVQIARQTRHEVRTAIRDLIRALRPRRRRTP